MSNLLGTQRIFLLIIFYGYYSLILGAVFMKSSERSCLVVFLTESDGMLNKYVHHNVTTK